MSGAPRRKPRARFIPISIAKYIPLHMKSNPGESRTALEAALQESLEAAERGVLRLRGTDLGAGLGNRRAGCFTCITGEGTPSDDYEITHIR